MDTMKDTIGQVVSVGDRVVLARVGYRDLVSGKIVKLTPKGCKVRWPTGRKYTPFEDTFRTSDMIVKVPSVV